jgi:hypothetical protein
MNMGVMIMTVRAHDARSAMYRMIRPAPDGRRRAKDPGPATRHADLTPTLWDVIRVRGDRPR